MLLRMFVCVSPQNHTRKSPANLVTHFINIDLRSPKVAQLTVPLRMHS